MIELGQHRDEAIETLQNLRGCYPADDPGWEEGQIAVSDVAADQQTSGPELAKIGIEID